MNLVSTIMQFLAPMIINKIAGNLGVGQGLAGKAISAAIPAILAGLAGSAAKPGGGAALSNVLAQQDPGLLGNFANMIGGSGQKAMTDSGLGALSSLLGGTSSNALTGAIGKFAGIDSGASSSLLGMLAPVVLGQLAQTQKSSGLDADGLTNLLAGQKSNIAAAMPAGFSQLLEGTGLLDSLAGHLKSTATAAPRAAMPAPAAMDSDSSMSKWIVPAALGVLGLYLLSSYGCNHQAEKVMVPATPPAATAPAEKAPAPAASTAPAATPAPVATPVAPAMPAAGMDAVTMATKALSGLTASLGGIKDEATAKAAVPGLTDIASQIAGVKTAAALMQGDARKSLASLIGGALPGITSAVEKAVGIPGVGALINPVLGPMVANLSELSK